MSDFSITRKKKTQVLEWLEANTVPVPFRFRLLDLANKAHFEGQKMPFPFAFNEFEHVVEHLAKAGLATFNNANGYRTYGITHEGQEFLMAAREHGFWASNIRSLRANVVTIVIAVATAVATSWAIYYWGAPQP